MSEKVQGFCPSCGHDSLFLGAGGFVTCGRLGCPNPGIVTDLLEQETEHIVLLGGDDFTVKHPLHERAEGFLFDCPVTHAAALYGPAAAPGKYRVYITSEGLAWEILGRDESGHVLLALACLAYALAFTGLCFVGILVGQALR